MPSPVPAPDRATRGRRLGWRLWALAAVVVLGAGCGRPGPVAEPTARGPSSTSPTAPVAAPAETDLAALLVRPPGLTDVPGDPLSGPIGRHDVGRVFVDHPDDPATVLGHGFVAGHVNGWKSPPPGFDPTATTIPATTVVIAMVLRFDTVPNADAVLAHFERHSREDGYLPFPVPAVLAGGYGFQIGPQAGITSRSVTWRHGSDLFQITAQYSDPPGTTEQVVELALTQERAL
ncbi:hypothetical protein ACI2K4_06700 [Micromonospora sp. NPDC050397]|uniref:hypothetical protein n=1 Tax=Micromonospora sp. NPDC050397 TaxID=3364279 RepID=UPI00384AA3D9